MSGEKLNNLALDDVATFVDVDQEGGGSIPDQGVEIPGRPGVDTDDEADYGPLNQSLIIVVRDTDSNGDVTHTDGRRGHFYENLSKIKREFRRGTLTTFERTVPHLGTVRVLCRLNADPLPFGGRNAYTFPLLVPSGSYQTAAEDSATGTPPAVVTGGDTEIHDPRLEISAAGDTVITLTDGTVYTITADAGPVYPVTVDVGAGTVTDANGDDAQGEVHFSHDHWLRLEADVDYSAGPPQGITADNAVTFYWRNRWS